MWYRKSARDEGFRAIAALFMSTVVKLSRCCRNYVTVGAREWKVDISAYRQVCHTLLLQSRRRQKC